MVDRHFQAGEGRNVLDSLYGGFGLLVLSFAICFLLVDRRGGL